MLINSSHFASCAHVSARILTTFLLKIITDPLKFKNSYRSKHWLQRSLQNITDVFSGAARRAGPDSMLIFCVCVCVCGVCVSEIISRPWRCRQVLYDIARQRRSLRWMR